MASKKDGYNPLRNRHRTRIRDQIKKTNPMASLPLEVIAFIKLKYSQRYSWSKIYRMTLDAFRDKIPNISDELSERRCMLCYEKNREEFRQARLEYTQKFQAEFNADREELLDVTLKAELEFAKKLAERIDKLNTAMDRLSLHDPDDARMFNAYAKTLKMLQDQLAKLTNTDRFRRLEENEAMLKQKKRIEGSADQIGNNEPETITFEGE